MKVGNSLSISDLRRLFPLALNAITGTKFRVVSGYVGTQETLLAIERGETEGAVRVGFFQPEVGQTGLAA